MRLLLCSWLCLLILPGVSVAQQSAPLTQTKGDTSPEEQTASPEQPRVEQKEKAQEQSTGVSKDRLFWTLPNFLTVRSSNVPPLATAAKFKVVTRSSFDPIEYLYTGFLSGISQASNSEAGYGQGAQGYGKRYGAAFGDNTIENFMTAAVLPSLLKEDPRFYQLGQGSVRRRTAYAVSRIFVTRTDSGGQRFNFSEVVGSALAGAVSTYSYHPREERNMSNAMSVWGTQVGWDTVTIVVKEFWPDIRHKLTKKKTAAVASHTTADPSKGNLPSEQD